MEVGRIDAERLVFVDEMGAHTSLAPLYAYSPMGERAFFEIPRNLKARTQRCLRASPRKGWDLLWPWKERPPPECSRPRLGALAGSYSQARAGCGDGQPWGPPAKGRVRELIEGRGCELIYLPPYSPDLNPIEEALSKVKHILKEGRSPHQVGPH
jgi:hypothetical protein